MANWSPIREITINTCWRKEEALRVEELQNAEFDRKLAQEEVWIRQ
ncbi:ABC transporter ATPase component, partial [Salmonella enterica subsp. enterica serovar Heidelberg str. N189]